MGIFDWSLGQFLKEAASSSPTPGGGSVAALTGALAASMAAMVANLTLGKEKFQEVAPDMERIRREAEETLEAMGKLMEADMEAFNTYMEALRLPKNTPEEKSFRQQKMQEALRRATEVPLEIAGRCFKVLELALEAARKGNEMAVSDAGVAGHLAWAALQAALLNVDINLPYFKDEELAAQFRAQRENLMEKGREVWERVVTAVQEKMIK
ncbi:Methenyltetrahydrofolate cyclohydrolase [Ammonifex degensii KC4]|uniref:Methenyltetrahydrofolate cyclohydrolase n=1 Tax=Ammonifex degensii (strain DSM 10501 / KC4) TaxID=429009 RepID=C9R7V8_AMMDK|nr:cyclodeaminase/cyclohydrolase family protein [Ammonifex degensii]ACX52387.1 Methenyltetrahydrofolate cyclohydrolase [Ammonifex degensii KC4]